MIAAEFPSTEISNGQVHAKVYLPEVNHGFYQGTRFDWSGVIYSLQYAGHDYYGPWFNKTRPAVHDFIYEGPDIVAGACSAITGPVDEFGPVGWDEAKPGGNFIKIGVGALKKPDDQKYDNYRLYEIADQGKRTLRKHSDSLEFIQQLSDPSSGYSYTYRKTISLSKDKPEMILEHSLRNTGSRAIQTTVYNHNFLTLDKQPPGAGNVITVPFQIHTQEAPHSELAEVRGNQIRYLKTLKDQDVVAMPVEGFGGAAHDHQIRIENTSLGAGMTVQSDRPLHSLSLWSIRTVIAMEPFIAIDIAPGAEFTWKSTYEYFTLPSR